MDILVKEGYLKKAKEMHRKYPVADAHLDLAGEILIRRKLGEENVIKKHYAESWKKAGLNVVISSVYVPTRILEEGGVQGAWEDTLAQIKALKEDLEPLADFFLITDKEGLNEAVRGEKAGVLLYMEGLDCIGEDISLIEELYYMGVRGASLTWSRKNALATGCCKAGEYRQISGGLSKYGRKAVEELERLSMFLDISHLNDEGFEEVFQMANRPFAATHSCARAVYDNYRNLTEKQMEQLMEKGGFMGLNGCKLIAGSKAGNHLEMLCRHAEYEVKKIGAAHVGFGFDLCDSYDRADAQLRGGKRPEEMDCFCDHSQIPLLTAALLQRGMKEQDVKMLIGGSVARYLEKVLP